ncbi:putative secreted protein (Por secretion system target) [Gelidibacter algens]|uniref:Putative secreted protein (Por secretion system target) n=1 Tax=Gelidibacter algens TaxID=49280 RepID=A0A1A7QIR8_9FLAO|nr:T9SS type A sorting domain-containing protein [Gelidibacter algens]OBX19316.1 hypothetical protein A9996_18850 [Gelidibacter algens]RAJ25127.1 putative secreted protein (Por secretion system target) [Gelidibacter algens]
MRQSITIRSKHIFVLTFSALFSIPILIKAQTLDLNAYTNYKGYETSFKNGFISKFESSLSKKWHGKHNNSLSRIDVDYDYHGITGSSMNIPRAQCSDSQGNIYITGSSGNIENNSGDITTIKVNSTGDIEWTLRIPSPEFTVNSGTEIAMDSDGFIYIVGYFWNQTSTDVIGVKMSNDGELIWQTMLGNSSSFDVPASLTVNGLGEMYIAGITYHNSKVTYYISKINSNGQIVWENIEDDFPSQTWNEPRMIHYDSNGDIIVCGTGFDEDLKSKTVTAKYSSDGSLIWKIFKTHEAIINNESIITDGWPTDFVIDNNDNIYVANNFSLEFYYSSMTLKYDSNGVESWNQIYQVDEENTRITNIFYNQNLIYLGGYHYGGVADGFTVSSLNLDGSLNWIENSIDQLSPSKVSMSMDNNEIYLNSIAFDAETFGSIFYSSNYSLISGNLINSNTFDFDNLDQNFTINDFFEVINYNDSKALVSSTFYGQLGNVYEVRKINNSDNSLLWNTKFMLQNSSKTEVLESVGDSNSNVFSLVRSFYVDADNPNALKQKSYILKHDANGSFISEDLIDDSGLTSVRLVVDKNDDVVVMIKEGQSTELKLKKFTNSLQLIWGTTLNLNSFQSELISTDSQNNIYIVSATETQMVPFVTDIHVSKYSSDGDFIFANAYRPDDESFSYNYATKILFDENDNLFIGGTSTSVNNGTNVPTLISISPSGNTNYFMMYTIQDYSSSLVDLQSHNNEFYLGVSSSDPQSFSSGIHLIKVGSQGQLLWQTAYFEADKSIFLNKLLYSANANSFYTVNFKGGFFDSNLEVVSWDLNGDLLGSYILDDNNYYQDAFLDAQSLYVLTQNQDDFNFPKRLINWAGPFISSKVTKISFDLLSAESFDFTGPNYSLFEPKQLIPLNNSNLLLSGRLFHEELFFEGLKFFSIPYDQILSVPTFPEIEKLRFYCYPNPTVNSETNISFNLKEAELVRVSLYDINGRFLKEMVNKVFNQGTNKMKIKLDSLSKGIYVLELQKDSGKLTTKLIVTNQ